MSPEIQIFTYWGIGIAMGLIFLRKELLNINKTFDGKRIALLIASALVVLGNALVYSKSTNFGDRALDPLTMIVFAIGNGVAETFVFFSLFKIGETLIARVTENKFILFGAGMLIFIIYSGLIHGLFWLNILPEHIVNTPENAFYRSLFMPIQLLIATSWSLSFFLYRDLYAIIFFHSLVDAIMVYCVRFSLFTYPTHLLS
ncbi:MAG: hypothetical protein HGB11_03215 [Chlorobiales bacterium]|nr:hypothetical protein [Chlorobiales bacterium]